MRGYWRFFRREIPLLTYGLSLTFLSSVGQTFLISLFVPFFLLDFALSEGGFGLLYSGATLAGGLLLPFIGARLDRTHLGRFTLGVVALLAISALLMAAAWHLVVLGLALVGVRLAGQGLSSHTALTAMARYYEEARGRALSIANLGFPLGEGILPLLLTAVIAYSGWRMTWVVLGASTLLFGPFLVRLLRGSGIELRPGATLRAAAEATPDGAGSNARSAATEAEARGGTTGATVPPSGFLLRARGDARTSCAITGFGSSFPPPSCPPSGSPDSSSSRP